MAGQAHDDPAGGSGEEIQPYRIRVSFGQASLHD